jgi:transposase
VDPARAGPGGACQGAAVQGPAGRAERLAAAGAGHLLHQGLPARRALFTPEGRAWLETTGGLSDAGRQAVTVALRQLDRLDDELAELRRDLVAYARRQPGCRALWTQLYGVGGLTR